MWFHFELEILEHLTEGPHLQGGGGAAQEKVEVEAEDSREDGALRQQDP